MIYEFLERNSKQRKPVGIYDKIPARSKYLIDEARLSDAIGLPGWLTKRWSI